jgi:hypothetical protein
MPTVIGGADEGSFSQSMGQPSMKKDPLFIQHRFLSLRYPMQLVSHIVCCSKRFF